VLRSGAPLVVLAVVLFSPAGVRAQSPGATDTQFRMERQQRRVIVRPGAPADVVERDVDAASAEVQKRERDEQITRELRHPFPRRPDLDYDVKSGIQSQRLNGSLRR
jgi:hypothetical protein